MIQNYKITGIEKVTVYDKNTGEIHAVLDDIRIENHPDRLVTNCSPCHPEVLWFRRDGEWVREVRKPEVKYLGEGEFRWADEE